ncbi:MAG TPA: pyrroline-5-carboxylate reductase dimerization domain-containing protein, partial [Calditrichia bacterium]|nr:pyrroline-5-carboxylate reductase dimerization domain-containing protein [Calditrichia bacterium]
ALDDLIAAVTSKGGTTEAAFKVFKAGHLPETLHNGVIAARDRAAELSKGK